MDNKKAADYRFEMFKELVDSILETDSKTMRNRVAGYLITLAKQVIYLQRISISELRAKYGLREAGDDFREDEFGETPTQATNEPEEVENEETEVEREE